MSARTVDAGPTIARIVSVQPSYGPSDTHVTIRANVSLKGATSVLWGGRRDPDFSVQRDGSILSAAPLSGQPGSTVPVTVILNGTTLPTTSTYTYPLGEVDVIGPSPFDPGNAFDYFWFNGGGRDFSFPPRETLTFGRPPVLKFNADFIASSYPYSPTKAPYAAGNTGAYHVGLARCDIGNDVPKLIKEGISAPCTNWQGLKGVWVTIGKEQYFQLKWRGPQKISQRVVQLDLFVFQRKSPSEHV